MQLTLLAPPNESILAELYGWGELPIDWISERGVEFAEARKLTPTGPLCMQSDVKCLPGDCSYTHIYMFHVDPQTDQKDVDKQQRDQMEMQRRGQFRLHHIHDGVECFAFM